MTPVVGEIPVATTLDRLDEITLTSKDVMIDDMMKISMRYIPDALIIELFKVTLEKSNGAKDVDAA